MRYDASMAREDATATGEGRRLAFTTWRSLALLVGVWVLLRWLSYPWPNQWWAAHLALIPLALAAVRAGSTRKLAIAAYVGGLLWWLIGVRWLWQVTPPGYIAVCFYLALYPVGFVLLVRGARRGLPIPLPMVLLVPLAWVALEWVRGWAMTGFPWFLLGHSQPTLLIQVADFAGAYGVSFVVAMTSGAIIDVLSNPLVQRGRPGRTVTVAAAAWVIAIVGSLGYGAWRVHQHDALVARFDGKPPGIDVAVVQTDVPQSNKLAPSFEEDRATFDALMTLIERAAAEHEPMLIGAPETIVPRAINDESVAMARRYCAMLAGDESYDAETRDVLQRLCAATGYRSRLSRLAGREGRWMIVGAHALEAYEDHQPRRRYNAAYLIGPDGRIVDRYDKVHRVPFGEYVPFRASAPWLFNLLMQLTPYQQDYSLTKGGAVDPLTMQVGSDRGAVRVGTPICFEDVVSGICRRMVYAGGEGKRVDLLMNLTNDGWYPGTAQGPQHEQIARFRCIENRVPMARAVNRGVSGLIDSCGRITVALKVDGERQMVAGVAGGRLHFDPRSTLFGRIGDTVGFGCVVIVGIGLVGGAAGRFATRRRATSNQ